MGDVNGDANYSLRGDVSTRSLPLSDLYFYDRQVQKGETVSIPVYAADLERLKGFQMSLDLSGEVKGVSSDILTLSASNYTIDNDRLDLAFADYRSTYNEGALFNVEVEFGKSGLLSDLIQISSNGLKPEIYLTSEVVAHQATLSIRNTVTPELILEQNTPNPFSDETVIAFHLPEAGNATLEVYNITGQRQLVRQQNFFAGRNTILLNRRETGLSKGVYYYTLTYGNQRLSKKMILVD